MGEVVSHHFLYRRADKRASFLRQFDPAHRYKVVPARRGPFRYRVLRLAKAPIR